MGTIIIWGNGKGLENLADETDPDIYKAVSREWSADIEALSPWSALSKVGGDDKSIGWTVSTTSEIPPIILIGPCSSSIDMAWYFHQKGMLPEWASVLTPGQSAGKGQFGREWFSPVGNIYGALRIPVPLGRLEGMASVIMGYLLVTVLAKYGVSAQLKWPNDILVNGRKTGGILIEERGGVLVAGIGLNLVSCPSVEQLRDQQVIIAGNLSEFGYDFKPLSLWRQIVENSCDFYYKIIREYNFENVIDQIHSCMAFNGSKVRVVDQAIGAYEAEVLGLSSNGGLKLMTDNGAHVIYSGSICPLNYDDTGDLSWKKNRLNKSWII